MKIKIISIRDSNKHFDKAIKEYEKRLSKEIEIIDIKPEKNGTTEQIIEKENNKIKDKLKKDDNFKVLLDKGGEQLSSKEIANTINKNNKLTFIIGGPYGINVDILKDTIDYTISLGKITLPHILTKLTLLEQIYRSKSILENKNYHY